MKRSELKEMIKEELLVEGSNYMSELKKLESAINNLLPKMAEDFKKAIPNSNIKPQSHDFAFNESYPYAERSLKEGLNKLKAIAIFIKKFEK